MDTQTDRRTKLLYLLISVIFEANATSTCQICHVLGSRPTNLSLSLYLFLSIIPSLVHFTIRCSWITVISVRQQEKGVLNYLSSKIEFECEARPNASKCCTDRRYLFLGMGHSRSKRGCTILLKDGVYNNYWRGVRHLSTLWSFITSTQFHISFVISFFPTRLQNCH